VGRRDLGDLTTPHPWRGDKRAEDLRNPKLIGLFEGAL
jgi:hypothetical protein